MDPLTSTERPSRAASRPNTTKRNRIPLSCTSCRIRKLRCDRQHPCHNCTARGVDKLCMYANGAGNARRGRTTNGATSEIRSKSPITGWLRDEDLFYRSGTHWDSVLAELASLRLAEPRKLQSNGATFHDTGLTAVKGCPSGSADELLTVMPSRSAADKLVEAFFDPCCFLGPITCAIHYPTFMKEYEQHWRNPSSSPLSRLALLYAIFSVSISFLQNETDNYMGLSETLATLYHTKSGQCLARISTNKICVQTLQAMLTRSVFEFSLREEWGAGIIGTMGSIVRLAMRQGLHRDPSHFTNITPFQGEMRRRIWTTLAQYDILSSFHLGMPAAIHTADFDTKPPRNLLDTDLEESMIEVPPERPFTKDVPIGYMLTKDSILRVMRRVVELLNSTEPEVYEKVLRLDKDLLDVYTGIPEYLRLGSWDDARKESPFLIIQKIHIETLYHQAVSVLHRTYLRGARTDPTLRLSQQRCVDSSLILLKYQASIYREAQPGGCLSTIQGYSITPDSENFSLAAMVLCLHLHYVTGKAHDEGSRDCDRVRYIFQALEGSRDIWKDLVGGREETRKVALVLDTMLDLLRPKISLAHADLSSSALDQAPSNGYILSAGDAHFAEHGVTLNDDPSTYILQSHRAQDTNNAAAAQPNIDMTGFDWDAWDSFVQGDDFETAYSSLLLSQEPASQDESLVNYLS
ncbi:hypothetical protein ETB97_011266 [Aspergillus alliaceus]|uniref:Zn(2)-C6 fungal-type domain-containing protein n=1 Tax=Petromyces alliaceus TaxID=209559 RepID=A0A8H6E7V1_PETAA|nr:hypothetical protein ETB97_011266 [Aspergillus burnettii]